MALLHQAELRPSKLELVGEWAPTQPWFTGDGGELTSVGAYRFDDPAGEVGVETLLVRVQDGPVHQVPLTYRGVPLADADEWLIGTLNHSVLGTRWVYDGLGDPVYLQTVTDAITTGATQAEQYFEVNGERVQREATAQVVGSGSGEGKASPLPGVSDIAVRTEGAVSITDTPAVRLTVLRVPVDQPWAPEGFSGVLTGTWTGQDSPQALVYATPR